MRVEQDNRQNELWRTVAALPKPENFRGLPVEIRPVKESQQIIERILNLSNRNIQEAQRLLRKILLFCSNGPDFDWITPSRTWDVGLWIADKGDLVKTKNVLKEIDEFKKMPPKEWREFLKEEIEAGIHLHFTDVALYIQMGMDLGGEEIAKEIVKGLEVPDLPERQEVLKSCFGSKAEQEYLLFAGKSPWEYDQKTLFLRLENMIYCWIVFRVAFMDKLAEEVESDFGRLLGVAQIRGWLKNSQKFEMPKFGTSVHINF